MLCSVISTMDNDGVGNLLYVYKYNASYYFSKLFVCVFIKSFLGLGGGGIGFS